MKTLLDVCAGIGGFSLAFKHLVGGFRTVGYVEIERYCREVLRARIRDGFLDDAPIFHDLREADLTPYRGRVDLLTAGFPCQPFSVAGKRKGQDDERNLWPDVWRAIRQVRPRHILLENVPGLLVHRYFGRILGDLAEGGYDARWDCIPASAVGANHRRDRLWVVATDTTSTGAWADEQRVRCVSKRLRPRNKTRQMAHPQCGRRRRSIRPMQEHRPPVQARGTTRNAAVSGGHDVADAASKRRGQEYEPQKGQAPRQGWWLAEPDVGRVAYGVPAQVDRLSALGNAVVPAVVAKAWKVLK